MQRREKIVLQKICSEIDENGYFDNSDIIALFELKFIYKKQEFVMHSFIFQ